MKRFQDVGPIWSALIVAGISAGVAQAASADSLDAPAQKLTQEFDLIPKLLAPVKSDAGGDPLKAISQRMTVVHGDLSKYATDAPVQTRERQILRSLDEMIAALQRQRSGMSRGSRPGTGRKDSVIAKGDPSVGDLHGVDPNARQWAQLPPKLRSEILQSKTDGFPPGYESLLQSYYQQLAEEKSLDDRPPGAPPAAKPADPVKPGSP